MKLNPSTIFSILVDRLLSLTTHIDHNFEWALSELFWLSSGTFQDRKTFLFLSNNFIIYFLENLAFKHWDFKNDSGDF